MNITPGDVVPIGFVMANKDDYKRAADAVQSGEATKAQRELNDRMARQAGSAGNDARAAREGRKTW